MRGHIRRGQRVMLGFIFVLGLLLAVFFIGRYVMADAIDRVDKANALITDILQARPDENAFIQNETTSNIRSPNFPRYIYGDQAKMRQVLLNFLSNAIKYSKQQ